MFKNKPCIRTDALDVVEVWHILLIFLLFGSWILHLLFPISTLYKKINQKQSKGIKFQTVFETQD